MTEDDREDWSLQEREGFASLPGTATPSADLEERVVAHLSAEGWIRARSRPRIFQPPVRALAAAAAVALFFLGWFAGHGPGGAPKGPRFALLLYEGPEFQASEDHAREYAAWAAGLRRSGVAVSGEELSKPSDRIFGPGAASTGGAETLAGFFLVGAPNFAAAESIARTCPHLRHRGIVVVRPVAGG
jgi:hypothetical protein